ncbi:MAG: MarR family transcriptional regulator [Candidatus Devosia phytovorans]|uniref:MarR family transcriptional regulator n=1 Tax=Candidatus Devosia phytovorans TaxID=3121372 RepID=A0AAJ5VZ55_9HYPH|nr:MarR family transcriptional regulator [Devosia sp.]WEK06706.1 MAG: MarR family transcriptional regulator [Devosia sp.]
MLRDYQKQAEAALSGLPGGSRAFLVMSLVQNEACQSQIAIAERIALDKTTMTYLIDALEKEDLVRRTTDPNDRRSRQLSLTPNGTSSLARYTQAIAEVDQAILSRLPNGEASLFKALLNKVAGLEAPAKAAENEDDAAHICRAVVGADVAC